MFAVRHADRLPKFHLEQCRKPARPFGHYSAMFAARFPIAPQGFTFLIQITR